MFILSKKMILALVAMAACMATLANAAGTRARARRQLKTDKSKKAGIVGSYNFINNAISANRPVTNINTVSNAFSYTQFNTKCPVEAADVDSCADRGQLCQICIAGHANFKAPTFQTLKDSCLKISGGHCDPCNTEKVLNYYNCGTGRNMTDTVVDTPSLTTPTVDGVTTPTTPVTPATPTTPTTPVTPVNPTLPAVSNVTVEIQSYIPGPHPNTAGGPPCPWEKPMSGGACDTLGYEWATCLYAGLNNVCSCWWNQPQWSCV